MNTETTKKPSKRERERAETRASAVRTLIENFGIGPTSRVYTVLQHVSSSGMSRQIACLVVKDDRICNISNYVAEALGWQWKNGAVVVSGCGMDAGWHLVYSLSRTMFHKMQGAEAGYVLKQEWL